MTYPKEQIDELKRYCLKVSALTEGNTYFLLEGLRLPAGCEPAVCDALLRPFKGADNYPSLLYFSVKVTAPYSRNWNVLNARICERNWNAFSWNLTLPSPTLAQMLVAHLTALTRAE
jgi:hypothetical protein